MANFDHLAARTHEPISTDCEEAESEIRRLEDRIAEFKAAIEHMDTKMTPLTVRGSEFIEMYQVMAGPWHRILGLARG